MVNNEAYTLKYDRKSILLVGEHLMIRKLVRHGSHGKAKRMSRVIVALEHTDMDITYTQKRGQSKQVPECNETLRLSVMCVSE